MALSAAACTSPQERLQADFTKAAAAANRGNLGEAERILRRVHAYDPRSPLVTTRLGQVLEQSERHWQALDLLESFPEAVDTPEWLNLHSRLLLRCGRERAAARVAIVLDRERALEPATLETFMTLLADRRLTPQQVGRVPDAWLAQLVDSFLDRRDAVTALAWMEQVQGRSSETKRLLRTFKQRAASSRDEEFVRRVHDLIAPDDSALGRLVRRRLLALDGRESEIALLDTEFLARYPTHPGRGQILVAEGRRFLARGESGSALDLANEALSLNWSDPGALVLRGLALEWSGRTEEAERAYRSALAADPGNQAARDSLRAMKEEPETLVMRIESLRP